MTSLRRIASCGGLAGLIALLLQACYSESFVLNEMTSQALYGRKMTPIGTVEVSGADELTVYGGGMAAVRSWRLTQSELEFYLIVDEGPGVILHTRSVPIEFDLAPGVALYYTIDGCRLLEKGRELASTDTLRAVPGERERILIRNDGHRMRILIGCDVMYDGPSSLPATEFLVVESLESSTVRLEQFAYGRSVPELDVDYDNSIWQE